MSAFLPQQDFTRIVELSPDLRKRIQAVVEGLIAILDEYDGEPDVEDGGDDEPSLGWSETSPGAVFADCGDEREIDADFEQDAGDMPENDPSENGIADFDALLDETLTFHVFGFDGSGRGIADSLLRKGLKRSRVPATPRTGIVCNVAGGRLGY